jgi:hypothetical protein
MMNSQTNLSRVRGSLDMENEMRTPQKPDLGETQAKEADQDCRHPGAYSLGHSWFINQEWKWAQWAKERAFRESLAKSWGHRGVCPSSLPRNWKGPVLSSGMDKSMSQVWAKLQTCEVLEQCLRRCHARSQRTFITAVLRYLDDGLADGPFGMGFHPDERREDGYRGLKLIRRGELRWLKMIADGTPIFYYENQNAEHLGERASVFLERVLTLVEDLSPTALFRDNQLKSIDDFRRELNNLRKKEVQGIAFSVQETILFTEKLESMGILR